MTLASLRNCPIRLGTGLMSLFLHNPRWVAKRLVPLGHLTRGRGMLGLGPGSLPADGAMIDLSQTQIRGLLEDGVQIIHPLLKSEEPVHFKRDRSPLRDARLHLLAYFNQGFSVTVAAGACASRLKPITSTPSARAHR